MADWHHQLNEPTLVDAILDRLVQGAILIEVYGTSTRADNAEADTNPREPKRVGAAAPPEERRTATQGRGVRRMPAGWGFVPGVVRYRAQCFSAASWRAEVAKLPASAFGGPRKCAVKFLEQRFLVFILVPTLADRG